MRRKPRPFGVPASHRQCATRAGIRTPTNSTAPPGMASPSVGRSPTTHRALRPGQSGASVPSLAPLHCRRAPTRPVSCYALFEGWLLLSQPPGCLRARTSFPTQLGLRDLSRRSGLLPSRRWSLAPTASLGRLARGIRGLVGVGSLAAPRPAGALPPPAPAARLPLKAFRGEPAISRFGWHFTSTHSSSRGFEPPPGSGLQPGLAGLHPGHG